MTRFRPALFLSVMLLAIPPAAVEAADASAPRASDIIRKIFSTLDDTANQGLTEGFDYLRNPPGDVTDMWGAISAALDQEERRTKVLELMHIFVSEKRALPATVRDQVAAIVTGDSQSDAFLAIRVLAYGSAEPKSRQILIDLLHNEKTGNILKNEIILQLGHAEAHKGRDADSRVVSALIDISKESKAVSTLNQTIDALLRINSPCALLALDPLQESEFPLVKSRARNGAILIREQYPEGMPRDCFKNPDGSPLNVDGSDPAGNPSWNPQIRRQAYYRTLHRRQASSLFIDDTILIAYAKGQPDVIFKVLEPEAGTTLRLVCSVESVSAARTRLNENERARMEIFLQGVYQVSNRPPLTAAARERFMSAGLTPYEVHVYFAAVRSRADAWISLSPARYGALILRQSYGNISIYSPWSWISEARTEAIPVMESPIGTSGEKPLGKPY